MTQTLYQRDFYSGIELRSVTDSPDYAPHFHDAYTIGLLTQGGQTIRTGRKAETAFAGSVQFHEPFQVHENHRLSPNEFSFRHIEISKPRLLQLLNERMPPTRPNHIPDGDLFQDHENHRLSPNEFSFRHIEISKPRLLQLLNERMPPTRPNHIPDGDLFQ